MADRPLLHALPGGATRRVTVDPETARRRFAAQCADAVSAALAQWRSGMLPEDADEAGELVRSLEAVASRATLRALG